MFIRGSMELSVFYTACYRSVKKGKLFLFFPLTHRLLLGILSVSIGTRGLGKIPEVRLQLPGVFFLWTHQNLQIAIGGFQERY